MSISKYIHRRIAAEYCGDAAVTKFPTNYFRIELCVESYCARNRYFTRSLVYLPYGIYTSMQIRIKLIYHCIETCKYTRTMKMKNNLVCICKPDYLLFAGFVVLGIIRRLSVCISIRRFIRRS